MGPSWKSVMRSRRYCGIYKGTFISSPLEWEMTWQIHSSSLKYICFWLCPFPFKVVMVDFLTLSESMSKILALWMSLAFHTWGKTPHVAFPKPADVVILQSTSTLVAFMVDAVRQQWWSNWSKMDPWQWPWRYQPCKFSHWCYFVGVHSLWNNSKSTFIQHLHFLFPKHFWFSFHFLPSTYYIVKINK